jgi:GNAT superfamily N-acetyltransferase
MRVTREMDSAWWSLFDPNTPNDVILRSVLAGRCPGLAYLDRPRNPTQAVVRAHGGKAFASSGVTEPFLQWAVAQASKLGWTALADTELPESVRSRGRVVDRTRFDDCDLAGDALRTLRKGLPPDVEMRSLDRELLKRCHHARRELPGEYGDRLDSYFDFGYGVCLLQGGEVACEAYAGFVADGRMEAIAGTVEELRGRGLASIASAFLAEEARNRGHAFTWSCLADNVGSLKVARRLGFRTERSYREIYF